MSRAVPLLAVLLLAPLSALAAQGTASTYRIPCEQGDLIGCTVLGLIYETGAAGPRDRVRALELYERSCNREVLSACRRLELTQDGATPTGPEDERVRVGYVADAYDGMPLGGAIVHVLGSGIEDRRYVTDQAGRVQLDPLPLGRHRIEVQRGGYELTDGQLPVPWEGDFLILMERVIRVDEGAPARFGGIFGQVTEEGTDHGIADVDIVITAGGESRTISNGQGRFHLTDLEPGPMAIEFRRLGYQPRVATVTIEAGRTVEIYATMAAQPIELEPVEVTVGSGYLQRTGFYRRAENVAGAHFTYRDIARMNPVTVGDVMRRVAGVTVVSSQIGTGSEATSNRRRTGDGTGRCRLLPYFNGVPTVSFDLEIVPPEEIEALEVYQGASVPIEFLDQVQSVGATCGVVLIWTRDPRRPF